MFPLSYKIGGGLVLVVAIMGFLLKQSYEANGKLREQNKHWEAANEQLATKLQASRRIEKQKQREAEEYRRRHDRLLDSYEDWKSDPSVHMCLDMPVPAELVRRLHDATAGISVQRGAGRPGSDTVPTD